MNLYVGWYVVFHHFILPIRWYTPITLAKLYLYVALKKEWGKTAWLKSPFECQKFLIFQKTGMLCYMSCTLAKVVSDDPSPVNIHSHMNFEFPCLHSSCSLWIDVKYWYILWSDFICCECHSLNMCWRIDVILSVDLI